MNIVDMQNTKQLAVKSPDADMAVAPGFDSLGGFELLQRQANLLASSGMVPDRYKGKLADCVIAMNMSNRMGADPLMTMQNLYIVHGTPAWSAQMMISVWNQCGRYTSIQYQFQGDQGRDDWGCKAVSIDRETGEPIKGALVTIGMAKAEGWFQKKGSKWQTMPEQMLRYRSAAWLVRAYAPELSMGFQTLEEVHDTYDAVPGKDGSFSVSDLRGDESGLKASFDGPASDDPVIHSSSPKEDEDEGWPRRNGEGWLDSRGFPFDERIHGMSAGGAPAVNKHGAYRMRRGCDPALHFTVERKLADEISAGAAPTNQQDRVAETQEPSVAAAAGQHADEATTQSSAPGFAPGDIALAIRRCTLIDDCDDVEDMLRECKVDDQQILTNLSNDLEERRSRLKNLDNGSAA